MLLNNEARYGMFFFVITSWNFVRITLNLTTVITCKISSGALCDICQPRDYLLVTGQCHSDYLDLSSDALNGAHILYDYLFASHCGMCHIESI